MEVRGTKARINQEVEAEMAIRWRTMAKLKRPGETGDVITGLRSGAKGC